MGYSVATSNLQAEQYGVPQTRKRAILVARNDGHEARLPAPTHSKYHTRNPDKLDEGVQPWVSMWEALGFGLAERPSPTVTGGVSKPAERNRSQSSPGIPLDPTGSRGALVSNYGTGGDASKRGERTSAQPAPTVTSKADRMKWGRTDIPAPTVAGDSRLPKRAYRKGGQRQMDGALRLTINEAKVLQSFPPNFEFSGGNGKQHLQNGNAIPPLLAEAILTELISNHEEQEQKAA